MYVFFQWNSRPKHRALPIQLQVGLFCLAGFVALLISGCSLPEPAACDAASGRHACAEGFTCSTDGLCVPNAVGCAETRCPMGFECTVVDGNPVCVEGDVPDGLAGRPAPMATGGMMVNGGGVMPSGGAATAGSGPSGGLANDGGEMAMGGTSRDADPPGATMAGTQAGAEAQQGGAAPTGATETASMQGGQDNVGGESPTGGGENGTESEGGNDGTLDLPEPILRLFSHDDLVMIGSDFQYYFSGSPESADAESVAAELNDETGHGFPGNLYIELTFDDSPAGENGDLTVCTWFQNQCTGQTADDWQCTLMDMDGFLALRTNPAGETIDVHYASGSETVHTTTLVKPAQGENGDSGWEHLCVGLSQRQGVLLAQWNGTELDPRLFNGVNTIDRFSNTTYLGTCAQQGCRIESSGTFRGRLKDTSVYGQLLSVEEVTAIYQASQPPQDPPPPPVGHYFESCTDYRRCLESCDTFGEESAARNYCAASCNILGEFVAPRLLAMEACISEAGQDAGCIHDQGCVYQHCGQQAEECNWRARPLLVFDIERNNTNVSATHPLEGMEIPAIFDRGNMDVSSELELTNGHFGQADGALFLSLQRDVGDEIIGASRAFLDLNNLNEVSVDFMGGQWSFCVSAFPNDDFCQETGCRLVEVAGHRGGDDGNPTDLTTVQEGELLGLPRVELSLIPNNNGDGAFPRVTIQNLGFQTQTRFDFEHTGLDLSDDRVFCVQTHRATPFRLSNDVQAEFEANERQPLDTSGTGNVWRVQLQVDGVEQAISHTDIEDPSQSLTRYNGALDHPYAVLGDPFEGDIDNFILFTASGNPHMKPSAAQCLMRDNAMSRADWSVPNTSEAPENTTVITNAGWHGYDRDTALVASFSNDEATYGTDGAGNYIRVPMLDRGYRNESAMGLEEGVFHFRFMKRPITGATNDGAADWPMRIGLIDTDWDGLESPADLRTVAIETGFSGVTAQDKAAIRLISPLGDATVLTTEGLSSQSCTVDMNATVTDQAEDAEDAEIDGHLWWDGVLTIERCKVAVTLSYHDIVCSAEHTTVVGSCNPDESQAAPSENLDFYNHVFFETGSSSAGPTGYELLLADIEVEVLHLNDELSAFQCSEAGGPGLIDHTGPMSPNDPSTISCNPYVVDERPMAEWLGELNYSGPLISIMDGEAGFYYGFEASDDGISSDAVAKAYIHRVLDGDLNQQRSCTLVHEPSSTINPPSVMAKRLSSSSAPETVIYYLESDPGSDAQTVFMAAGCSQNAQISLVPVCDIAPDSNVGEPRDSAVIGPFLLLPRPTQETGLASTLLGIHLDADYSQNRTCQITDFGLPPMPNEDQQENIEVTGVTERPDLHGLVYESANQQIIPFALEHIEDGTGQWQIHWGMDARWTSLFTSDGESELEPWSLPAQLASSSADLMLTSRDDLLRGQNLCADAVAGEVDDRRDLNQCQDITTWRLGDDDVEPSFSLPSGQSVQLTALNSASGFHEIGMTLTFEEIVTCNDVSGDEATLRLELYDGSSNAEARTEYLHLALNHIDAPTAFEFFESTSMTFDNIENCPDMSLGNPVAVEVSLDNERKKIAVELRSMDESDMGAKCVAETQFDGPLDISTTLGVGLVYVEGCGDYVAHIEDTRHCSAQRPRP